MNNIGMNNQRYCSQCGAPASETALFCVNCGEKLSKDVFCANCGSKIPQGARFCQMCGAQANACFESAQTIQPTVRIKKKKQRRYSVLTLIKSCLLVLMSIIMLTFCFFNVASYDISTFGMEMKLSMTPVRNITLFFDSFGDYNAEDIKESSVYGDMQDTVEELSGEIPYFDADMMMESIGGTDDESINALLAEGYTYADILVMMSDTEGLSVDFSSKVERLMNKLVYQSLRLSAQSEDVSPTLLGAVNAVFSLVYMLVCVAAVVLSIINLLLLLLGKSISDATKKMLGRASAMLLIAAPLMAVVTCFTTVNFVNMGGFDSMATVKLGFGALAVLITGGIGIISCATLHMVEFSKSYSCRGIITHSVALGAALVTLCLVFTPVMTTAVKTVFNQKTESEIITTSIKADYFDSLNFDEETAKLYKDQTVSKGKEKLNALVSEYKNFTKAQVRNEVAKPIDYEIMTVCIAGLGGETSSVVELFALTPVILALAVLMAAMVAWQAMCYLCTGRSMLTVMLPVKILLGLLSAAALALVIVFVSVVNYNLNELSILNYITGVSAGIIAFVSSAVVAAAMPMLGGGKKRAKACCCEMNITSDNTETEIKVEDVAPPTV